MTTIIGLQGKTWSILASDSKISIFDDNGFITSQSLLPSHVSKIVDKDGYLIGAAGDVRAINILHHVYEPPSLRYCTTQEKIEQHITKKVVPTLRSCFDAEGYSPPDKGDRDHKAEHGSSIIISIKAQIFVIEEDYSWAQDESGIYVIGTGQQYARGAIHALTGTNSTKHLTKAKALEIIKSALLIASAHDPYTGAPFHVFSQLESE